MEEGRTGRREIRLVTKSCTGDAALFGHKSQRRFVLIANRLARDRWRCEDAGTVGIDSLVAVDRRDGSSVTRERTGRDRCAEGVVRMPSAGDWTLPASGPE